MQAMLPYPLKILQSPCPSSRWDKTPALRWGMSEWEALPWHLLFTLGCRLESPGSLRDVVPESTPVLI